MRTAGCNPLLTPPWLGTSRMMQSSSKVSMQKSTADSHQKLLVVFFFHQVKHTVPHLASSRVWEGTWAGEPVCVDAEC